MAEPKIVTLHYMVDPILSEISDKILYVIKYFIHNPGYITTEYSDLELSFRGIATRFPDNPQNVVDMINATLGAAIQRLVPNKGITTQTNYKFVDTNNYSINLAVLGSDGLPIIPQVMVSVIDNELKVKYQGV